jgi:hypothetical protein
LVATLAIPFRADKRDPAKWLFLDDLSGIVALLKTVGG